MDAADALPLAAIVVAVVALGVAVAALLVARRERDAPRDVAIVGDPVLDQLLASQMQRLDLAADELMAQAARLGEIEGALHHAVRRFGIVRYNPFEDTGGNQSFALALLDDALNGVVITSLHARTGTRVYLRTIVRGASDTSLSAEETEALRQAGVDIRS
ncbi:MAG: DUF4446 family protein [Chloroflexi bacterium]|nr:DUF4446 family protein [Chloroflexota bacterium]